MKRVIYVLTDNNIGGAGRWLLNLLRCLDRTRYEAKVLLPEESALRARVEELGFETLCVDGMRDASWDRASLAGMTALFHVERPDIVHIGASLTARLAARRARVPAIVVTKHCAAEPCGALGRCKRRLVDTLAADKVVAVSRAVGEQLAAAGTPREKLCVICNGIMPVPPYDGGAREALRESLGLDRGRLWVGVAARLEAVKGVDLFLDAARRVLERRDDVRFAVFGVGSQEAALRAMVSDLGDKVRFLGFCDEIEQALGLLDVAVVPSRSEAFCLSAAEALSMGTPVAAFDVDGVSEVVRDGVTGRLAPAGDTAALAARIEALLDDPALRLRLGEQGRELVLREFTAETMTRKTEALYDELAARKGR